MFLQTILLLVATTPLFATQPVSYPIVNPQSAGSVSSTSASFDGTALVLSGHVILNHGLGNLSAEGAALERQDAKKDFPFSLIHLQKDVILSLKNSSQVHCHKADLDFNSLTCHLSSGPDENVTFIESIPGIGADKREATFQLLGKDVELRLSKHEKEDDKIEYRVDSVLAKHDIIALYDNLFTLYADHATYKTNDASLDGTSKKLFGTLFAFPKDSLSKCRIVHENDQIEADQIQFNLATQKLLFKRPQGKIHTTLLSPTQKGETRFVCREMEWDYPANNLLLRGKACISESTLGTVTSEQIALHQSVVNGIKALDSITAIGPTTLEYQDATHKRAHKLISYGSLNISRSGQKAIAESPMKDGHYIPDNQIYYEEDQIAVFANRAEMEYSEMSGTFQPVSIALKGNIRVFSHDPTMTKRCGLADRATYSPSTRTFILAASPGNQVIFWDEEEQIQISAQEIHITQDTMTKKEVAKGVGNVKLTLSPEEKNKLKSVFPEYAFEKRI